jgi:hypothetical protein
MFKAIRFSAQAMVALSKGMELIERYCRDDQNARTDSVHGDGAAAAAASAPAPMHAMRRDEDNLLDSIRQQLRPGSEEEEGSDMCPLQQCAASPSPPMLPPSDEKPFRIDGLTMILEAAMK